MSILKNLKIKYKLLFLSGIYVIGIGVFGILSYYTINKIKINGNLYNNIIKGKDLVADILPPPEYIIESYLIVEEMVYTQSESALNDYINDLKKLENNYNERHQYWFKILKEGELKTTLVKTSYEPAIKFYNKINDEVIPLLKNKKNENALNLIINEIKPLYSEHRKAIDRVVKLANQQNESIEKEAMGSIFYSFIILISLLIILIFISIIFSFLIITSVTKPIKTISETSLKLSDGDLTMALKVFNNDEIGLMSINLNKFLNRLNSIIYKIKSILYEINTKITRLVESINNSKKATADINFMTNQVKELIISQSTAVTEVSATIEEMVQTIKSQDERIVSQSATVTESSSAIEEMIANIKSIGINLDNSSKQFNNLENAVSLGNQNIGKLNEIIIALSQQSDIVIKANEIIKNIASQTELLSMNAAIEAAHAGDSGKGFAVVADEIRKLAELSNDQSKLISDNIKKLKESINLAVVVSSETDNSFNLIVKALEIVASMEEEIKNSLHEQNAGSNQLLDALKNIGHITGEVHNGSSEMLTGSNAILKEIIHLVDITEKVKNFTLQVAEKTDSVNNVVENSIIILNSNVDSINKINEETSIFKVSQS